MKLYAPHSRKGHCRSTVAALPDATFELCGDQGIYVAVGFTTAAIVYRGTFNKATNTGSWNCSYIEFDGPLNPEIPAFDIDYACKMALRRVLDFIEDYPT